mgnify:CR=1 FL=1
MANKILTTRIQIKHDTAENWAKSTLVLLSGEIAIDTTNLIAKVGDGTNTWAQSKQIGLNEAQVKQLIQNNAVQTVTLSSGTNNGTVAITVDGTKVDNIAVTGLGSAAYTNSNAYATAAQGAKADAAMPKAGGTFTGPVTLSGDPTADMQPVTKKFMETKIASAISASDAMIFKGTIGTDGTVSALPESSHTGNTYKVIAGFTSVPAASSATGNNVAVKTGDLIVFTEAGKWLVVPSGDERETTIKAATTGVNLDGTARTGSVVVGMAAAKQVDESIAAASTSVNLPTSKAVAAFVEGKKYKTTDENVKNVLNTAEKAYLTGTTSATTNTGTQIFDTGVYLDAEAGTLVATKFKGSLVGNVTGNVTGDVSGNAGTATKLKTARSIGATGVVTADAATFDGSGNANINIKSVSTDGLTNGSNDLVFDCGGAGVTA